MAYTKTQWVTSETALSADNLNHIEDGIEAAHEALEPTTLANSLIDILRPIGSYAISSDPTWNPNTAWGGTWTMVRKSLKYQWLTSGFSFNTANTSEGSFVCIPNGNTIELRLLWKNKKALSDASTVIGTLNATAIGLNGGLHAIYGQAQSDALAAIGQCRVKWEGTTGTLDVLDWVTRAGTLPTKTGQWANLNLIFNVGNTNYMIDSFCDLFYWKRTA